MIKYIICSFLNLFFLLQSLAQNVASSGSIIAIIEKHCTTCHNRKSNVTPFPIETLKDVALHKKIITYVINTDYMPPWYADSSIHHLANNRKLTTTDKKLLLDWINNTSPLVTTHSRKENKRPSIASFDSDQEPDMIIKMNEPYQIQGNNKEAFITQVLDINLNEERILKAVKIVPGNMKAVHHARLEIYDSLPPAFLELQKKKSFETITPGLPELLKDLRASSTFIYVPGLFTTKYPDSTGHHLKTKQKALLFMHYAPSSVSTSDETKIYLYFDKKHSSCREVYYKPASFTDLTKQLPANTITYVKFSYDTLLRDISVFAIQLHMHLTGTFMKLSALLPNKDTLVLMQIPKWNFYWQEYYYFDRFITLPKGTVLLAESWFDNTIQNPNNPNFPPKTLNFAEMDTKNEMMSYIIEFVHKLPNDENKKIDY